MNSASNSQTNLKVVKTETKSNGESIQLVRPYAVSAKSTAEIVGDLVSNFSYRTMPVKASETELNAVQQAFGSSLASELIKTYDGSHLVSDSQQDLIGERYLAEQIKLIEQQQKDSSVLNKWSHLLYEGEKYDKSSLNNNLTTVTETTDNAVASQSNASINKESFMPSQLFIEKQAEVLKKSDDSFLNEIIEQVKAEKNLNIEQEQSLKDALENIKIDTEIHLERVQEEEEERSRAEAEARVQSERFETKFVEEEQQSILTQATNTTAKYMPEILKKSSSQQNAYIRRSESQQNANINNIKRSGSQHAQQPFEYLPQLSNSNLNSVSLDAYNSPQFKSMLDQVLKPITVPAEETELPPKWPSPEEITALSEPIYIPAPLPIVIPAPNMLTQTEYKDFSEEIAKPYVTHYPKSVPSIASDQEHYQNFGIRQLHMDRSG